MLVDRIKNTFAVKSCIFVFMHFKCTCTYTYNVHIHGLYCISIKIYMANMKKTYMNNSHVSQTVVLNISFINFYVDLGTGSYVTQRTDKCEHLCINRSPCCDKMATCRCGTYTGNFECLCRKGYYGTGLYGECFRKFQIHSKNKTLS